MDISTVLAVTCSVALSGPFPHALVMSCWHVVKGILLQCQKQPQGNPLCLACQDCSMSKQIRSNGSTSQLQMPNSCCRQLGEDCCSSHCNVFEVSTMPAFGWVACLLNIEQHAEPQCTPGAGTGLLMEPMLAFCLSAMCQPQRVSDKQTGSSGTGLAHLHGGSLEDAT